MTTLKTLLDQRISLDEQLEAAYGAISPEMEAALTEVELNLPQKVDRYIGLLDRLKQDQELFESKAEKYDKRAKAIKNLREKLKENIKAQMVARNITELGGNDESFKLTTGKPTVIVESTAALPQKYLIQTLEQKPNKELIREALQKGEILSGVQLQTSFVLKRTLKT